jgi:SAM-dependent methyltransferase
MNSLESDKAFAGSIPQLYEQYMVPLIFEPYAADLARRVSLREPSQVLEVAAGTGVVTRQLASALPPGVSIVASDLNQPMLEHAAAVGTTRPVGGAKPMRCSCHFPTNHLTSSSASSVSCSSRTRQRFSEARRVLRAGGFFIFNVWDRIDENDFAYTVTQALETPFPADPPRFLARVPHAYHDSSAIAQDLARGGFSRSPEFATLAARSRADSPRIPAVAYCQGTPLRSEIEARGPSRLSEVPTSPQQRSQVGLARRSRWRDSARIVTIER